jgi:hypothetical protein
LPLAPSVSWLDLAASSPAGVGRDGHVRLRARPPQWEPHPSPLLSGPPLLLLAKTRPNPVPSLASGEGRSWHMARPSPRLLLCSRMRSRAKFRGSRTGDQPREGTEEVAGVQATDVPFPWLEEGGGYGGRRSRGLPWCPTGVVREVEVSFVWGVEKKRTKSWLDCFSFRQMHRPVLFSIICVS